MTATYRSTVSATPTTGGPDHRIRREDITHEWRDSFAAFRDGKTASGTPVGYIPRDIEVQAFRPTMSDMSVSPDPLIALGLHGRDGEAMVLISKAEAKEVALMLLQAVNDCGPLEVAAYMEAHPAYLGDEGDDTDGMDPRYVPA